MSLDRPSDLYDRERQWSSLAELVAPTLPRPGLRLAILSGRRRHGKSFVLRRIVQAAGGIYHQARVVEKSDALRLFAEDVAEHLELAPSMLRFDSWESAFRAALGLQRGTRATGRPGGSNVLVLDELPYLLTHSPEIPSVLQLLHDEAANTPDAPAPAVILCGSALSVMNDLLIGSQPLRGRAQLDVTMPPFDFRQARGYWGVDNPRVAFHLDAVLGGTPGYRPLIPLGPPEDLADWPSWLGRTVLNPASALFDEKSYLLREDPRNLDRGVFNSILLAVADGRHTPTAIASAVGRDYNGLKHPLGILESTGFLTRTEDVLTARRPTYHLADPIIRFAQVVIDPHRDLLEEGLADVAWDAAEHAYSAKVLGPHFEHIARHWTARYSGDRWGDPLGEVGSVVVNDPQGRSQHEIDVVGLQRGDRRHSPSARILVLGEAKSSTRARTLSDLQRLETVRELLVRSGREAGRAQLVLFSLQGFDENLLAAASTRPDVHLVDLEEMYDGGASEAVPLPPPG